MPFPVLNVGSTLTAEPAMIACIGADAGADTRCGREFEDLDEREVEGVLRWRLATSSMPATHATTLLLTTHVEVDLALAIDLPREAARTRPPCASCCDEPQAAPSEHRRQPASRKPRPIDRPPRHRTPCATRQLGGRSASNTSFESLQTAGDAGTCAAWHTRFLKQISRANPGCQDKTAPGTIVAVSRRAATPIDQST